LFLEKKRPSIEKIDPTRLGDLHSTCDRMVETLSKLPAQTSAVFSSVISPYTISHDISIGIPRMPERALVLVGSRAWSTATGKRR
jgi:hypothetical protein